MTREEHLQSCKICKNQKYDPNQGIICGLTNSIATFQDQCEFLEEDSYLKEKKVKEDAQKELAQKTVGKGVRLANYILDFLFIIVLNILFYMLIAVIILVTNSSVENFMGSISDFILYLISFLISFIYYTALEGFSGRTMAKFITRTKVVAENGEKVTFNAIVLRSLCRFIPFDAFSFLNDDARGWHDTMSKTRVISVK
ncbi:RDD family protein [Dokdonia sp.]|uniref:RDD family protein n=1 Tax=Dokdonia sp. TaxID=2024995 RepID=UPI0032659041